MGWLVHDNCDKLLLSHSSHLDESNWRTVGKNRTLENMDKRQSYYDHGEYCSPVEINSTLDKKHVIKYCTAEVD